MWVLHVYHQSFSVYSWRKKNSYPRQLNGRVDLLTNPVFLTSMDSIWCIHVHVICQSASARHLHKGIHFMYEFPWLPVNNALANISHFTLHQYYEIFWHTDIEIGDLIFHSLRVVVKFDKGFENNIVLIIGQGQNRRQSHIHVHNYTS